MIECESCVVSKAYKIVLRKLPASRAIRPFYRVHIDLFLGIMVYNSDVWAIHFFDEFTRMNKVEMFT